MTPEQEKLNTLIKLNVVVGTQLQRAVDQLDYDVAAHCPESRDFLPQLGQAAQSVDAMQKILDGFKAAAAIKIQLTVRSV
jgi:hypothetical protein